MASTSRYRALSDAELFEKLTILATRTDKYDLDHAFCGDERSVLAGAVSDGMESLMEMAKDEEIGWEINAGQRCDVPFDLFSIRVCDNRHRQAHDFELQALTPMGVLAAGILVIMQARLRLNQVRSVLLQQLENRP